MRFFSYTLTSVVSLFILFKTANSFAQQAQTIPKPIPALETVNSVDIKRYVGKWYEIASIPQWFTKGCTGTTAEYKLTFYSSILSVTNTCYLESLNGIKKQHTRDGYIVDTSSNSKFLMPSFWPVSVNYWIIELADDYSYSVIGNKDRSYLWILSRTPQLSWNTFEQIKENLETKHHYNIDNLQRTIQPEEFLD